jgi:hypothetical protein
VLKRSASAVELGVAVIRAIESFEYLPVAPSTTEIEDWNNELYRVVGIQSERGFERGASVVDVAEEAGRWVVKPQDRRRGYWVPMDETTYLHLTEPRPEDVGHAVRQALGS